MSEELQKQLDASEEMLKRSRDKCSGNAARMLQLAVRLRVTERRREEARAAADGIGAQGEAEVARLSQVAKNAEAEVARLSGLQVQLERFMASWSLRPHPSTPP